MNVTTKAPAAAKPSTEKVSPNQFVALDHIVNHKDLSYRSLDTAHVDALAADIAVNGLDIPLLTFAETPTHRVKLKGAQTDMPATFLVAGLHRRAALLKFRREHGEAFKKKFANGIPILHRICSVGDALLLQIRENVARREMSAEEIFPILEKLSAAPYNMSGKEIAKRVSKSPAWVSSMMAVNEELDPTTKEEVVTGKIATGDARKLAGDVRKEKKSGAAPTKESIRERAEALKQKQAAKAATGAQRAHGEERKVSLKKIWERYQVASISGAGRRVQILEEAVQYSLGLRKTLPAEVRLDKKAAAAAK
jgi:ParB-like chromosome segregation protein Spo0J